MDGGHVLGGIGRTELMIVLVLGLILFGAGRLPQAFESFGKSLRAFREQQEWVPVDRSPEPFPWLALVALGLLGALVWREL